MGRLTVDSDVERAAGHRHVFARFAAATMPELAATVPEDEASWRVRWAHADDPTVRTSHYGSRLDAETAFHAVRHAARDRGLLVLRLEERGHAGWAHRSRGLPVTRRMARAL